MKLKPISIVLIVLIVFGVIGVVIYKVELTLQTRVEAVFAEKPALICPIGTMELSSCGYYSVYPDFYWDKRAEETSDQRYCGEIKDDYRRSACYESIAQAKRDANICQYATEDLGCEEQVAYNIYWDSGKTTFAPPTVLNTVSVEKDLSPTVQKIIVALRDKNLVSLEPYVDSEKGVLFGDLGDYGTKLMQSDLATAFTNSKKYPLHLFVSHDPEQITFKQFFDRYVWSEYTDTASVKAVYYIEMKGRKNIDGTVFKVNPNASAQFILPTKNNPEPINNTFINLYFEKKQGAWYLIGTTHSDDDSRGLGDAD